MASWHGRPPFDVDTREFDQLLDLTRAVDRLAALSWYGGLRKPGHEHYPDGFQSLHDPGNKTWGGAMKLLFEDWHERHPVASQGYNDESLGDCFEAATALARIDQSFTS